VPKSAATPVTHATPAPLAPPHVLLERLALDPTAFVAPGASVVGRVTMAARSSAWFSAVMRGDMDTITLGEESNLQDGAVIHVDSGHPTVVGRRVTIGHGAIVHAATVEDGCMIGMGAIVLTGAVVGVGSLVGAGALVREGQVVPKGSLVVGSPARVLGPVTAEHTAAIQRGVGHYVALAQAYRARGYAAAFPASPAGLVQRPVGREGDVHWHALLELLRATPARLAQALGAANAGALHARPAPDAFSALDVLCHLRDVETDVYAPRFQQMIVGAEAARRGGVEETAPMLTGRGDIDRRNAEWRTGRDYAHAVADEVLANFARARAANLALLAPLGPGEWSFGAVHPSRGPVTLYEQVERVAEHDLAHQRQLERALARGSA